jgi:uncharacterized membrane protein
MDWKTASRLFFGLTMIAIGVIGIVSGDFAPIWQPVPETTPERQAIAYLCTFVSLACGAGLLLRRTAAPAALALLAALVAWTVAFKGPFIVQAPLVEGTYQSIGESVVLISAMWVLYAETEDSHRLLASGSAVRIAYLLYGLALIAFGLSHFVYLELTSPLVPKWMHVPVFWSYLTGGIYLATGLAIALGTAARWGSIIAAAQIALITLLVWGPIAFAGHLSAMHWQETIVSWALTAGAWVLASGSPPTTGWIHFPSRSGPSALSDSRR